MHRFRTISRWSNGDAQAPRDPTDAKTHLHQAAQTASLLQTEVAVSGSHGDPGHSRCRTWFVDLALSSGFHSERVLAVIAVCASFARRGHAGNMADSAGRFHLADAGAQSLVHRSGQPEGGRHLSHRQDSRRSLADQRVTMVTGLIIVIIGKTHVAKLTAVERTTQQLR